MAARIGKVAADTSAFFLCDVQDKFRPLIRYFPEICTVANRLSAASKALDIPLVVSEHYPKALGNTVPEIDTGHGTVFPKTSFSMAVKDLKDHVKTVRPNLKSVILYGIEAQMCVQQTALDFLEEDYDVHVIADATSSRTMTERLMALERMKQSGAFITTSESILFMLLKDAKHERFREIQKIIMDSAPYQGLVPNE
eukprot:TCONS_00047906-protein